MSVDVASQEKRAAAMYSVVAALGLTALKVVVGFWTGSLGILAEAAHSGLDLVAALITYMAIHLAVRPADGDHPYGHGKIENLSAMVETLLLLFTSGWIIWEAVHRLGDKNVEVQASFWAFAVMIVSIVVDVYRSRHLYKMARKHNSQALEADALHFSTDIYSSAVVIVGLIGVKVAQLYPELGYLKYADAIAAIGVAVIVAFVCISLGLKTIQALLDQAPHGLADRIRVTVESMPGVIDCHQVRLRYSGPTLFADIHVMMDGRMTLEAAHELTDQIEQRIQAEFPNADITVHPEPAPPPGGKPGASSQTPPG